MSVTLLIVVKAGNGYTGSNAQMSVTSQVLKFNSKFDAAKAETELHKSYQELNNIRVYTTILEGTA